MIENYNVNKTKETQELLEKMGLKMGKDYGWTFVQGLPPDEGKCYFWLKLPFGDIVSEIKFKGE